MKKILAFLLIFMMWSTMAWATASSVTVISDYTDPASSTRVIRIKAVAASTDGSYSDLTLRADGKTSGCVAPLSGWIFYSLHIDGDHAGAHDGSGNAAILSDTDAGFIPGALIGYTISNATDGSTATITANSQSTVTGTLTGGTQNDWDAADTYTIAAEPTENSDVYFYMGGIDILDANGVDQVDNTTERDLYFAVNGVPATRLITGDIVITTTQAAVATNSALVFYEIILTR